MKQKLEEIISHLKSELLKLRAGRASIELVESVLVEAYNTKMPINQLATLSSPEPRLVIIEPWDKGNVRNIEKALRAELSDMNPIVDGDIIRIPFPAPTEERRRDLAREVGKLVEEAKIRIRRDREDALSGIKGKEERKEISEDEMFRTKEEIQKAVDEYNKKAEEMGIKKEEEILGN